MVGLAGPPGSSPVSVLMFLASPRCAGLDDMHAKGLFMSDIPLHDVSSDFILLTEHNSAELNLKERYEKLSVELKVGPQAVLLVTCCWSTP